MIGKETRIGVSLLVGDIDNMVRFYRDILGLMPKYQRMGYGKQLLERSFEKAIALGYDTIVIFGNPNELLRQISID